MKRVRKYFVRAVLAESLAVVFGLGSLVHETVAAPKSDESTPAAQKSEAPKLADSTPANPATTPPLDLPSAESTYREIYGTQHDAAEASKKPADKFKFAQTLLDAVAKLSRDPSAAGLCWVMRQKAANFATSSALPSGYPLAVEALKANLALTPAEPAVLEPLTALMEKWIPTLKPEQRTEPAYELAELYIRWTDLQIETADLVGANKTLLLARNCIRTRCRGDARLLGRVQGQERQVEMIKVLQTKADRAKPVLAVNPNDPQANMEVGLCVLLVERKPDLAFAMLSKSPNEPLRKLGEALSANPADEYALAEAYRAASGVPGTEPTVAVALKDEAYRLYRKVLAENPEHPEAVKIKLILSKDPTAVDPDATTKTSIKKAEPKVEPGSPGPGWVRGPGWQNPYFPDRGFLIRFSDNYRLNVPDQFIQKSVLEETFEGKMIEVWLCQQNKYYHVLGTLWFKVERR